MLIAIFISRYLHMCEHGQACVYWRISLLPHCRQRSVLHGTPAWWRINDDRLIWAGAKPLFELPDNRHCQWLPDI
ncbi:MAG: hypothetical protein P8Z40_14295, partial [Chloroflexota bacterium]